VRGLGPVTLARSMASTSAVLFVGALKPAASSRHQVGRPGKSPPSAVRGRPVGQPHPPLGITVSQLSAFANGVRQWDCPQRDVASPQRSRHYGAAASIGALCAPGRLEIGQVIGQLLGRSTSPGISRVRYADARVRCIFFPWQVPMAMVKGHFRGGDGLVSDLNPPPTPTRRCGSASSEYGCASCAPVSG